MTDTSKKIRVFLADDHELFRTGIVNLLNSQPDFEVIGEVGDGLEAQYRAIALDPDLILMDINMPGVDGIEAVENILKTDPDLRIIMLTVHDEDEKVMNALKAGAKGYILKNTGANEFLKMLRGSIQNEAPLSPKVTTKLIDQVSRSSTENELERTNYKPLTHREKETLMCINEGLMDKEISAKLQISIYTVKSHVRNIISKLEVKSRHEAVDIAKRIGLID